MTDFITKAVLDMEAVAVAKGRALERADVLAMIERYSESGNSDDERYLLGQLQEHIEGGDHEGCGRRRSSSK